MKSKSSPELRPRPMDAVVALAVALLAIAVAVAYYGSLGADSAAGYVITHRGEEVASGSLSEPREIAVEGEYHLRIVCDGQRVTVTHSDCPTQDCVRTGSVSRPGQTIVCLPEQVIVKIVGHSSGPDLVIG